MPEMDGSQLCAEVRKLKNLDYVYFIMLTVVTEKNRLVEAFEVGVDDFITKPFCESELLARLRAGMRDAPRTGRTEAQVAHAIATQRPVGRGERKARAW